MIVEPTFLSLTSARDAVVFLDALFLLPKMA